ncbi:MAG: hypothetical protein MZV49_08155 [Rhodopseudomonas palustris]|nr:hypothetical protein [Rhodopseudomonas palustris]
MLSPWLGLSTATHLQDKFDQPLLHEPTIPIGAEATSAFAPCGGVCRARPRPAQTFIAKEEQEHYVYLRDFA